jgi:hypothetical protein
MTGVSSGSGLSDHNEGSSDANPGDGDFLAGISLSPSSPPAQNAEESRKQSPKKRQSKVSRNVASPECSLSLSSPAASSGTAGESEVSAFLAAFNSKYNVFASTLFDVLDLIDSKVVGQKRKSQTSDSRRLEELKSVNLKLQGEKEALASELATVKNQLAAIDHGLQTVNKERSAAIEGRRGLEKENENIRQALDSINQLMEAQIGDVANLGRQRGELLALTTKQDAALAELERLCQTSSVPSPPRRKKVEPLPKTVIEYDHEEVRRLLSSVLSIAEQSLDGQGHSQTDSGNESERILSIVQALVTKLAADQLENRRSNAENEKLKGSLGRLDGKYCRMVSLFEEELQFLQTLVRSSELQGTVFRSRGMTEDVKEDLVRRCATVGRQVEEMMGAVSEERFRELYPGIRPTHVFDLLHSTSIEEKLEDLTARFDTEDESVVRELFDVLAVQVFINELLVGHAGELRVRIVQYSREATALRQALEEQEGFREQFDAVQQLAKRYRRQENKIRRLLAQYNDESNDVPVLELVKRAIEQVQVPAEYEALLREKEQEIWKLNERVQEKQQSDEQKLGQYNRRNQELQRKNQDLEAQLNEMRTKFQAVIAQSELSAHELEALKLSVKEKESAFAREMSDLAETHKDELKAAKDTISALSTENSSLVQQVAGFESTLAGVKQQRQKLGKQIERLENANKKLAELLETQSAEIRSECQKRIQEITTEHNQQIHVWESRVCDCELLTAKVRQLQSEIATLNVAKRSIELKNRALEERMEMERKTIQSQAAAQVNANFVEYSGLKSQQEIDFKAAAQELAALLDSEPESADFRSVISALVREWEKLHAAKVTLCDLSQQLEAIQKVLGVDSPPKIVGQIRRIIDSKNTAERKLSGIEETCKKVSEERDQLLKDARRTGEQVSALKLWENWGQRVYRLIHASAPVELRGKDLRVVLEESVLASISQTALASRIQILRDEKTLLLKFDRRVLNARPSRLATLRPLVALFAFLRKIQRFAGHAAIAADHNPPSQAYVHSTARSSSVKKNRRSSSVRRTSPSDTEGWPNG